MRLGLVRPLLSLIAVSNIDVLNVTTAMSLYTWVLSVVKIVLIL